jgi:Holliday junction resolvase RusA-like endonuclease
VYYPGAGYAQFRGDCQRQGAETQIKGLDDKLVVVLENVVPKPKTTGFKSPSGDVDNFAKGALDAFTDAGMWLDDRQIEVLVITKRWVDPGEDPHLNVNIGTLED